MLYPVELTPHLVAGQGLEPCSVAYETTQFTRTVTRIMGTLLLQSTLGWIRTNDLRVFDPLLYR